ncbi:MAG: hypothetical protein WHX93_11870 [bacterium]
MECPKCGFRQPEELYCARCGVHIPSALKRQRRRTLAGLAVSVLAFLLLGAATATWWLKQRPATEPELLGPSEERQSIPRIQPAPPLPGPEGRPQKQTRPAPSQKNVTASKKSRPPTGTSGSEAESKTPSSSQGPPPSPQIMESDPEVQLKRWAAQEWVDRARELVDDPEQEMEMYLKALEVDPGYAPAHYHLGMLYWRKADREMALEEFQRFWKQASAEERRSLPLPEELTQEEQELFTQEQQ